MRAASPNGEGRCDYWSSARCQNAQRCRQRASILHRADVLQCWLRTSTGWRDGPSAASSISAGLRELGDVASCLLLWDVQDTPWAQWQTGRVCRGTCGQGSQQTARSCSGSASGAAARCTVPGFSHFAHQKLPPTGCIYGAVLLL